MKYNNKVFDVVLIAMFSTILFVLEQILMFLPNIQLTVFLIMFYSKKLGFLKTSIIVFIYVLLDNIFMASLGLFYTPFMLIGWMLIPVLLCTLFNKVESVIWLSCLGILFSLLYSWVMIIPNIIINKVDIIVYLINDIPFEILLSVSSFISVLWLYKPCEKCFDSLSLHYKK